MNALDRLSEIISERDARINELEEQISQGESFNNWRWRDIRKLSEAENLNLPIPRLEIRHYKLNDGEALALYGIVHKHFLGDILLIPFSATKVGSARPLEELGLPFRDGAHIRHDMRELNLRGFLVGGKYLEELSPLAVKKS